MIAKHADPCEMMRIVADPLEMMRIVVYPSEMMRIVADPRELMRIVAYPHEMIFGPTVGFLSLQYSVAYTVESLSLVYLLFVY